MSLSLLFMGFITFIIFIQTFILFFRSLHIWQINEISVKKTDKISMVIDRNLRIYLQENYLYSGFTEIKSVGQIFARKYIRVLCLFKSIFQLMKLVSCESCPAATDFPSSVLLLINRDITVRKGFFVFVYFNPNIIVFFAFYCFVWK